MPEQFSQEQKNAAKKIVRWIKALRSARSIRDNTQETNSQVVDIHKLNLENIAKLRYDISNGTSGYKLSDLLGRQLPEGFSKDIGHHAEIILQKYYLKPFKYEKYQEDENPIYRRTHGAMHASRVAILVRVVAALYNKFFQADLREEDVILAQISGLFHDCARLADYEDMWDSQSSEQCYLYLRENNIEEERALLFANAIRHKDALPNKTIISKLVQMADALDIIRVVKEFRVEMLDFYRDIAKKDEASLKELFSVIVQLRLFIQSSGDLWELNNKNTASIWLFNKKLIEEIKSNFNLSIKKQFEHSDNCFLKTLNAMSGSNKLAELYQYHFPSAQLEYKISPLQIQGPLSLQEKALLEIFQSQAYSLHHSLPESTFNNILENADPALRYIRDRQLHGYDKGINHIPAFGGAQDNVYFGIIKDQDLANFSLVNIPRTEPYCIVLFDLNRLEEDIRKNLWAGGHFYYYEREIFHALYKYGCGYNFVLGGVELDRKYFTDEESKGHYRQDSYKDKDGNITFAVNGLGYDFAKGSNIFNLMGLNIIAYLRLLGQDNQLRKHVLENPHDGKMISALLEVFFDVQTFEIKSPFGMPLNSNAVTVIYSRQIDTEDIEAVRKKLPEVAVESIYGIAHKVNEAASCFDIEKLKEYKQLGYPFEGFFYLDSRQRFPLVSAIKGDIKDKLGNIDEDKDKARYKTIDWLIENGAGYKYFNTTLIDAQLYLSNSIVNLTRLAIMEACSNDSKISQYLEDKGFNKKSAVNQNSLSTAISYGMPPEVIIYMIKTVENYEMNENLTQCLLKSIADKQTLEILDFIIEYKGLDGLCISIEENSQRMDFIGYAYMAGKSEIVKHLIKKGQDPLKVIDQYGNTLLHLIARNENVDDELLKLIRDNLNSVSENINDLCLDNNDGQSPLFLAIENRNNQVVEMFLDIGYNPFAKMRNLVANNSENTYPVYNFCKLVDNDEAADLFLRKASCCKYPLHMAIETDNVLLFKDMLAHAEKLEFNLAITNDNNLTVLELAQKLNKDNFIKELESLRFSTKLDSVNVANSSQIIAL